VVKDVRQQWLSWRLPARSARRLAARTLLVALAWTGGAPQWWHGQGVTPVGGCPVLQGRD